jgi:hypothetical protein
MEVIIIESKAFDELNKKLNLLVNFVLTQEAHTKEPLEDMWVDGYAVQKYLYISERTLQRLRSKRLINYSIVSGKCYYTIGEIKRMLEKGLVRRNEEKINELTTLYKQNMERIKKHRKHK